MVSDEIAMIRFPKGELWLGPHRYLPSPAVGSATAKGGWARKAPRVRGFKVLRTEFYRLGYVAALGGR